MTPTSTPEPFTGLTVQAVAEATGLSRGEIYQVGGILDLGAPAHFRYVDSILVYTPKGLAELAEGMQICGHGVAAGALHAVLAKHRATPPPVAEIPPPSTAPEPRGWMAEHEARQEDAA